MKEEIKQKSQNNHTSRDQGICYEQLNKLFHDFEEEKYGIRKGGYNTVQNKDKTTGFSIKNKMSIQQFLSLKNQNNS